MLKIYPATEQEAEQQFKTSPNRTFMKPGPLPARLFKENRARLAGMMREGSLAVAGSNRPQMRSGDQYYPFRQNSGCYYLTGINQPDTTLLLKRDFPGVHHDEILFIRRPSERSKVWEGPGLTPEEASELSAVSTVRWSDELSGVIRNLIKDTSCIYRSGHTPGSSPEQLLPRNSPELNAGEPEYMDLTPLVNSLRMVKAHEEIGAIKAASEITRAAFRKVLPMVRPGIWEFEIEGEITGEFIRQGAMGHAFEPIVASGRNALVLHYLENSQRCRDGELILMDFGAEVNNYASDCTRTIPVNGKFSVRQREIYDAVHRIFCQAREWLVPGTLINDFHERVGLLSQEEHLRLGLYGPGDLKEEPGSEPAWKRFFMHSTSHSLGLDVHDPFDRQEIMRSGMVFTCEPAIYIPEEGIGIRLENTLLVTDFL